MNREIFKKTKQGKKTVYSLLYKSPFLICVYNVGVCVLCMCVWCMQCSVFMCVFVPMCV